MRLDFHSTTEFKRQGYITGLLPQVLKFFPRLNMLFVAATAPDAISLMLQLGSELSSSIKVITFVSSLAVIEKAEESLEKFEEQMEMLMFDAEERERWAIGGGEICCVTATSVELNQRNHYSNGKCQLNG